MPDEKKPSERRLGRAAIWIVAIILVLWVVIFVTRNISHYQDLKNEEAANNAANAAAP